MSVKLYEFILQQKKVIFLLILQYGIDFVTSVVKFYDFVFDLDVETEKKFRKEAFPFMFVPCIIDD